MDGDGVRGHITGPPRASSRVSDATVAFVPRSLSVRGEDAVRTQRGRVGRARATRGVLRTFLEEGKKERGEFGVQRRSRRREPRGDRGRGPRPPAPSPRPLAHSSRSSLASLREVDGERRVARARAARRASGVPDQTRWPLITKPGTKWRGTRKKARAHTVLQRAPRQKRVRPLPVERYRTVERLDYLPTAVIQ